MEYYNKIMCVNYEELTTDEGGEPVIKRNTLDSLIRRGNTERIKRGGGEGSCALIVYNSLPEKYRQRYESIYGDPVELFKKAAMKDKMIINEEARRFYEYFEYCLNGVQTHLSGKLIDEYTVNASVLNLLVNDLKNKVRLRKQMNNSNGDVWEIITGSLEKLRETYNHTLPNNLSRIQDKIRKYNKPVVYNEIKYPYDYTSIISGKIGNKSTLKITKEVGELLIALKRSRKPVFTDTQIFERFNEIELPKHNAEVSDPKDRWKPLKSRKSMVAWLNQEDIVPLWYDATNGELAARQKFNIKINTELASKRDVRWEGDGTKLNLYYRGEDGKLHTCTVYEVIDTYSEALLGYWISETENYWQQYHAFRMAVQNTRRKPYEIVTDNQGGAKTKRMQDFMKAISRVPRATMPNNPQSKTIENVLGRFQQQVLHQLYGFTGQNITTKKDSSKPNLEFVNANIDKLPTLAELKEKYIELREMWNGERVMLTTEKLLTHPGEKIPRMEMYLNSANELAPEVTEREMAESFWLWTDKPSTFNPDGIEIEVNKEKYKYDVFAQDETDTIDVAWRQRNTYRKFWVKFDPYDMSQIKLYWEDKAGERRFERLASPPVVIHRAIQDQQEGEMATVRRIIDLNKQAQIGRFLTAKEIEWKHGVAPEQNGLYTPKLNGFTNEEMAEVNLMLERRTRKYRSKSVAQMNKDISMMTYDEVQDYDLSKEKEMKLVVNGNRMASKL